MKCENCGKEFNSEFAGFFAEIVCPDCEKQKKAESEKVIDLTYKLHPEWKGNGIEHP